MKRFICLLPTIVLWAIFGISVIILTATFTPLDSLLEKSLVHDDRPVTSDVIIILGGGVDRDTHSLPAGVEERIAKGVELYKAGWSTNVIVSGGLARYKGYAESELMAPVAESLGVPAANVFEEDRSKDTYTNATYSQQIMKQKGWTSALVVTSDFHTGRACRIFKKVMTGVTCIASVRNSAFAGDAYRNLTDFRSIIREYGAWVYNWLRGNV